MTWNPGTFKMFLWILWPKLTCVLPLKKNVKGPKTLNPKWKCDWSSDQMIGNFTKWRQHLASLGSLERHNFHVSGNFLSNVWWKLFGMKRPKTSPIQTHRENEIQYTHWVMFGFREAPKRSWSDSPDQSDRKIIIHSNWYMYRISVHFSVYFPWWLHPFFIHACARSPQRAITYARQTIEKKTVFVVRQAKARPKRRRSGAVSPVGSEMSLSSRRTAEIPFWT